MRPARSTATTASSDARSSASTSAAGVGAPGQRVGAAGRRPRRARRPGWAHGVLPVAGARYPAGGGARRAVRPPGARAGRRATRRLVDRRRRTPDPPSPTPDPTPLRFGRFRVRPVHGTAQTIAVPGRQPAAPPTRSRFGRPHVPTRTEPPRPLLSQGPATMGRGPGRHPTHGEQQLGVISVRQIREQEGGEQLLRTAVRHGWLVPMHPRGYRFAGAPRSWRQSLRAAIAAAGPDAWASHETAAALWGMPGFAMGSATPIHITVPRRRRAAWRGSRSTAASSSRRRTSPWSTTCR